MKPDATRFVCPAYRGRPRHEYRRDESCMGVHNDGRAVWRVAASKPESDDGSCLYLTL